MNNSPDTSVKAKTSSTLPKSESNQDEKRVFWIALGAVAIVVAAVVFFNMKAPDMPAAPGQGSNTPSMQQGAHQTGGPAGDGTAQNNTPQRADTPTPPGREAVGAPVGAAPPNEGAASH